jgi:hypothetical protein
MVLITVMLLFFVLTVQLAQQVQLPASGVSKKKKTRRG